MGPVNQFEKVKVLISSSILNYIKFWIRKLIEIIISGIFPFYICCMEKEVKELIKIASQLGFSSETPNLYDLADWLREEKNIHVEVGSIWDNLTNHVESYCYTITAPIKTYYFEPIYASGGKSYTEMLFRGLAEAVSILDDFTKQAGISVSDDQVVISYLKGYGDKDKKVSPPRYKTNIEKYAYLQGRQGDYIEEGLTEEDIVILVRNLDSEEERLKLEQNS